MTSVYDSATTAQSGAREVLTDGGITGGKQRQSDLYNVAIIFLILCVFSCPCMNFQLSVSAKRIKKSQDLELAVGAVFASQSLLQQSHV